MKSNSQMTDVDIPKFLKNPKCILHIMHFSEMIQNANGTEISEVKHFSPEAACHFSDSYFFVIVRQVVLTVSILC